MEISKALFLFLFSLFVAHSHAYIFYVGGSEGWVLHPSESYFEWAGRNRFQVNDTLVFKYTKGNDSVLEVSRQDYENCNLNNPIQKMDTGYSEFIFDRSGPFFFVSGTGDRCKQGEKLIIVVMAVGSPNPVEYCHPCTFYVGGWEGWVLHPSQSYSDWAGRNRFQVNDTLVFKYTKGNDSVLEVSQQDYDNCNLNNPIQKMDSGYSVFRFDRSGPFFFVSGTGDRCKQGEKLIIVVMAVRCPNPITPLPPSTPMPPATPTPSMAPALTPGSNSPAVSPAISPSVLPPAVNPGPSPTGSLAPSPSPFSGPPPMNSPVSSPLGSPGPSPSGSLAPSPPSSSVTPPAPTPSSLIPPPPPPPPPSTVSPGSSPPTPPSPPGTTPVTPTPPSSETPNNPTGAAPGFSDFRFSSVSFALIVVILHYVLFN